MHEKFRFHIKVLYATEMLQRFRIFLLLEREISSRDLVNRKVLRVRKLSRPDVTGCLTDLPCALEVECDRAKHGFAKRHQPIQRQILIWRRSAGCDNPQDFSELPGTEKNHYPGAQRTKVHEKVLYLTHLR